MNHYNFSDSPPIKRPRESSNDVGVKAPNKKYKKSEDGREGTYEAQTSISTLVHCYLQTSMINVPYGVRSSHNCKYFTFVFSSLPASADIPK